MTVRFLLGLAACAMLQANEADLRRAFLGKQVMLKIDMPGTQQGVDLSLDRDDPMDWKQYSQRVKNFGVAAKFDVYDNSNIRKDLLAAGAKEISIPALDGTVYQSVDKASQAFSAFTEGQEAGYTERRYCRTWLRECFAQLEEVAASLQ